VKFYFHPRADNELDEAVQYYENCQGGLGLEFAEEVYAAIGRISEYPDAWAEISMHTRRCLLNRFPYGVIFQVKSGMLRIIAVANLHRRSGYWRDRI
jgi:hypothetical protein